MTTRSLHSLFKCAGINIPYYSVASMHRTTGEVHGYHLFPPYKSWEDLKPWIQEVVEGKLWKRMK